MNEMADTKSNFPYERAFLSFWMLGGSVACYVAALITYIDYDNLGYLIFTIVGSCFLVLGIVCIALILKPIAKDPTFKAVIKSISRLIGLTIIVDIVMVVITSAL